MESFRDWPLSEIKTCIIDGFRGVGTQAGVGPGKRRETGGRHADAAGRRFLWDGHWTSRPAEISLKIFEDLFALHLFAEISGLPNNGVMTSQGLRD